MEDTGHTMHVPLELDLIDEGRFIKNISKAFGDIQEQLLKYVAEHKHKAEKAKAKLGIEIILICTDPEDGAFACGVRYKKTLPAAPVVATFVTGGQNQLGQPRLMCRTSGSSGSHPNQQKLFTEDGREIDQKSGEIKPLVIIDHESIDQESSTEQEE